MTFRIAAESSANNNFLPVSTWIYSLALFAVGPRFVVRRVWPYCERSTRAKSESRDFVGSDQLKAGPEWSDEAGITVTGKGLTNKVGRDPWQLGILVARLNLNRAALRTVCPNKQ